LKPAPPSDRPPLEQIMGAFDRLERTIATGVFRGCPFVNAVAELKEPAHAANRIALTFKEQRRVWFQGLLERLGIATAERLSMQLQILMDGAIAAAIVRGDPAVAAAARAAAKVLVEAASVSGPRPIPSD
ncbi:MAG: TetR/AcrR family transcriptional regulator, partial [Reyranella sp.]|nr:TetR/AcrR family transcriptional regulator [Reyranella sp.]